MARVILDSGILIALFNDLDAHNKSVVSAVTAEPNNLYFISAISFAESLIHAFQNNDSEEAKENILRVIDDVIDVDTEIAVMAAAIRAKKISLLLPDAFISATAQVHGLTLWTTDKGLASVTPGSRLL